MTSASHYSGDEGRNHRPQTPQQISDMPEDELRKRIIELKETGSASKQMDAYELYLSWSTDNIPQSAHTIFHAAHAYLLSGGGVEPANRAAELMHVCQDYSHELWGDWLADAAIVSASRGDVATAYNLMNESGVFLVNAPPHKRLRNRFFSARMNLKHGSNKSYAVQQIWEVREALLELYKLGQCDDKTLLRNVNWWTIIASARYQKRTVRIIDSVESPFSRAYFDGVYNNIKFISETRPKHMKVLRLMKRTGPVGRLLISWYIIHKDRT